jgi:hypothetical protein
MRQPPSLGNTPVRFLIATKSRFAPVTLVLCEAIYVGQKGKIKRM